MQTEQLLFWSGVTSDVNGFFKLVFSKKRVFLQKNMAFVFFLIVLGSYTSSFKCSLSVLAAFTPFYIEAGHLDATELTRDSLTRLT